MTITLLGAQPLPPSSGELRGPGRAFLLLEVLHKQKPPAVAVSPVARCSAVPVPHCLPGCRLSPWLPCLTHTALGSQQYSAVPVQSPLLALLRDANLALLCPHACNLLATAGNLFPAWHREMELLSLAVPGLLLHRAPDWLLGCRVNQWEVIGSPCLLLGWWWHTSCLHQPTAARAHVCSQH